MAAIIKAVPLQFQVNQRSQPTGGGQAVLPVFKIQCIKDMPRFDMPLLLGSLSAVSRTAFACLGEDGTALLVTTAGAVTHCKKIEVFKPGEEQPFHAVVTHYSAGKFKPRDSIS